MRGHEEIIAMRHSGFRPDTVSIHAGTDHSRACRDWRQTMPTCAHVEIPDDDSIAGLDLRFTVGMLVFITGDEAGRVSAIHAACLAGGAHRVVSAAVYCDPGRPNSSGVVGQVLDSKLEAATCI